MCFIRTVGGRSFNQQAAERHIPQCKNIINKPSRLTAGANTMTRVGGGTVRSTAPPRGGSGPGYRTTEIDSGRNMTMSSGAVGTVRRGSEGIARYRR